MSSMPADLSTQARIRQAAVETFAAEGFARATVRQIATQAGVSPGLVIHHFGSKEGLRAACDDWAMDVIRDDKSAMALGGGVHSMRAYLTDHPEYGPVMDYLVAGVREGGEIADRVWDRLVQVTRELLTVAERSGLMRLPEDRETTAAYLTAASFGIMLLGPQFSRTLGGRALTDPEVFVRYGLTTTDIFTSGIFMPDYGATLRAAILAQPEDHSTDPEEVP